MSFHSTIPPREARAESPAHSRRSQASSRTGRCDGATYAEAMAAVTELETINAGVDSRRVTNQVDRLLLDELEEQTGSDRSDSLPAQMASMHRLSSESPQIEGTRVVQDASPLEEGSASDDLLDSRSGLQKWGPRIRTLVRKLAWIVPVEIIVGLLMLAPTIATVAMHASDGGIYPGVKPEPGELLSPPPPPLGIRVDTGGIFLLILRPMYALLVARLAALLLKAFFNIPIVQYASPGIILLLLHHTFSMVWALPAILYPAAIGFFYGTVLDRDVWDYLLGVTHFLALAFWLMAAGLSSVVLDCAIAIWQSQLTIQHYENRSASAYYIQKGLRKIAAAARTAKRRMDRELEAQRKDEMAAQVLQAQARALVRRRAAWARRQEMFAAIRHSTSKTSSRGASPFHHARASHPGCSSSSSLIRQADSGATHEEVTPALGAPTPVAVGVPVRSSAPPKPMDAPSGTVSAKPRPAPTPSSDYTTVPLSACAKGDALEVRVLSSTFEKDLAPPPRSTASTPKKSANYFRKTVNPPLPAGTTGAFDSPPAARPKDPRRAGGKAQALDKKLNSLAGRFDLGSDISSASTLSQARRRAIRLFKVIVAQSELRLPEEEGQQAAVDRDKLIAWAHQDGKPAHPRLASLMFSFGRAIDQERFVAVVEQSYREQRLITASVAAFDRLHNNVRIFLQLVLLLIFLIILLALFSVSIVTWLLPVGSAILSVAVLAGGITSDVLDSFFFAYVVRPYDIGDTVCIAQPGEAPRLFALVIKEVYLMRTHFYTANGESLVVNNSALRRMGITNFTRSGPMTMMIELMVPAATPSAKMTELADAVTSYVDKSNEWARCELHFYSTHFDRGHFILRMWCESTLPTHELGLIHCARGSLLLFCHAYMQSAGIEYLKPTQPVRFDKAPSTTSQSLAELFDKTM